MRRVECPTKIATKMVFAYMPAWSPNGAYIAFNGKLREIVENHPHDAVMIMDATGNNKTVLYSEAKEEANFQDICWTRDGNFLIWLQGGGNNYLVKVLNILTQDMVDITVNLTVNGLQPTNLWTSPDDNRIVFNKYEPGGGDLYEISYKITDTGHFQVDGTYSILAAQHSKGAGFSAPDWQLWTNID
jgi:Tol biopolymer transport system component